MPDRRAAAPASRPVGRGARLAACGGALTVPSRKTPPDVTGIPTANPPDAAAPAYACPAAAVPVGEQAAGLAPLARRIAGAVRQWLATGLRLGPESRAFLEAQLGLPGLSGLPGAEAAARLAPLLAASPEGQAAADAESALEYLLYPDGALRLSVERLLAEDDAAAPGEVAADPAFVGEPAPSVADFHAAPCARPPRLADQVLRLLSPDATAVLHVPDAPGAFGGVLAFSEAPDPIATDAAVRLALPAPPWALALLVRRLRLDRSIPACIARAVAHHLPEPQALAVRLALRDARFDLTEPFAEASAPTAARSGGQASESRADLVLRFIRRMPPSDPGYVGALDIWLDMLHDLPPGKSAHAALSARRERLARAAREADEFTARLGRLNMEILMLQGVHAPALDADEARRRVRLMDRMSLAVLGRPAASDQTEEGMAPDSPVGHDLGAFDPATGLDDLMRLLS